MSGRVRNGLAATELALATVLPLIGAGLFIQSLANLQRVKLGFEPHGLITFQLAPPTAQYPLNGRAQQLYRTVLESLQTIPFRSVASGAAVSSGIPFGQGNYSRHPMITTEKSLLPQDAAAPIDWRSVSPGFFKLMGIPLIHGRDFTGMPMAPTHRRSTTQARPPPRNSGATRIRSDEPCAVPPTLAPRLPSSASSEMYAVPL